MWFELCGRPQRYSSNMGGSSHIHVHYKPGLASDIYPRRGLKHPSLSSLTRPLSRSPFLLSAIYTRAYLDARHSTRATILPNLRTHREKASAVDGPMASQDRYLQQRAHLRLLRLMQK